MGSYFLFGALIIVGFFEPIVIFFRITNLPAIFQAMINEILRDLINERKVIAFIDDVLVGTKTKKGHNEIVKKILKRLEEKNLYIKPEKCIVMLQVNFPQKITFDKLYNNGFLIGICSRTLFISSECNII